MLLLAALTLTWWWLRPSSAARGLEQSRTIAWLALALTILTGATGSVAALADTLFPSPSLREGLAQDFAANAPLLLHMRWMHPAAAALALVAAVVLCRHLSHSGALWIGSLLLLQIALGVADMVALAPVVLQVLHLLGADLFWIALVASCSDLIFADKAARAVAEPALVSSAQHP
jgi:cytochrome c oxidase assembly protein subunit 15